LKADGWPIVGDGVDNEVDCGGVAGLDRLAAVKRTEGGRIVVRNVRVDRYEVDRFLTLGGGRCGNA
jgi:hypothetical protein